ncbi:MAG: hypothetical protein EXS03_00230 [Phycisphaerales bacterium]|nr:hypothetical protein [Phycisphaerales bacterium]
MTPLFSALSSVIARRWLASVALLVSGVACDRLPGAPSSSSAPPRGSPQWTLATFDTHCRGCHSMADEGASIPLMDRSYWTFASDAHVIDATTNGQGGLMPAFLDENGGPFTADEIAALARGMRTQWGGSVAGSIAATYTAGNAVAGGLVFAQSCGSCHGPTGTAGSLLDPSYLRLVSDQGLWASTLAGRKALGMPAWNEPMPGRPSGLTPGEAADVVSWIASQRPGGRGGAP